MMDEQDSYQGMDTCTNTPNIPTESLSITHDDAQHVPKRFKTTHIAQGFVTAEQDTNRMVEDVSINNNNHVITLDSSSAATTTTTTTTTNQTITVNNNNIGNNNDSLSNEIVTLPPPIVNPCIICGIKSKYSCPGCNLKTCSLPCVNQHKQQYNCNGKAKDSVYVDKRSFDSNILLDDLKLLTKVEVGLKDTNTITSQSLKSNNYNNKGNNNDKNNGGGGKKFKNNNNNQNNNNNNHTNDNEANTSTQNNPPQDLNDINIQQYIKYCQNKLRMNVFTSFKEHSTYKANKSFIHNILYFKHSLKHDKNRQNTTTREVNGDGDNNTTTNTTNTTDTTTTTTNPTNSNNSSNTTSNNNTNDPIPTEELTNTNQPTSHPTSTQPVPNAFKSCAMITTSLLIPNDEVTGFQLPPSSSSSSSSSINNNDSSNVTNNDDKKTSTIVECVKHLTKFTTEYINSNPIPSFIPLYSLLYSLFSPVSFSFKGLKEQESDFWTLQQTQQANHHTNDDIKGNTNSTMSDGIDDINLTNTNNLNNTNIINNPTNSTTNSLFCTKCTMYNVPHMPSLAPMAAATTATNKQQRSKNKGNGGKKNDKFNTTKDKNVQEKPMVGDGLDSLDNIDTEPTDVFVDIAAQSEKKQIVDESSPQSPQPPPQPSVTQLPLLPTTLSIHNNLVPLNAQHKPMIVNTNLPIFEHFRKFQHTTPCIEPNHGKNDPNQDKSHISLLDHRLPQFCTCQHSTQVYNDVNISKQNENNNCDKNNQDNLNLRYANEFHQFQPLYLLIKLISPANNPKFMDCPLNLSLGTALSSLTNTFPTVSSYTNINKSNINNHNNNNKVITTNSSNNNNNNLTSDGNDGEYGPKLPDPPNSSPQDQLSTPIIIDFPRFIVVTKEQREELYDNGNISLIAGMKLYHDCINDVNTDNAGNIDKGFTRDSFSHANNQGMGNKGMSDQDNDDHVYKRNSNDDNQNNNNTHKNTRLSSQRHSSHQGAFISTKNPFLTTNDEEYCADIMLENDLRLQSLRYNMYDPHRPTANLVPSGEYDDLNNNVINNVIQKLSKNDQFDLDGDDDDDDSDNDEDDDDIDEDDFDDDFDENDDDDDSTMWDNGFMKLINKYRN